MRFLRKTLSLDFACEEIKVIEGKYTQNNIQILKAITIKLPPELYHKGIIIKQTELAKLIGDKLRENKIKAVTTHAVISTSEILIREIMIPKVLPSEVKSVVKYQLADYLPVNIDEYVVQYLSQGTMFEGDIEKMKILLLAIPKQIVQSYFQLLKNIGLRPQVLDYQGNAMAKLLDFNNMVNQNYPLQDLAIASIDIGNYNSKITITRNGKIEATRLIDFGRQTIYSNILSFFEYSIEEIEEKLSNIESLGIPQEDEFSDEARFFNIIRSSLTDFFEKVEGLVRYYNTREVGNVLDCILLQGSLSDMVNMEEMFSAYFNNVQVMRLRTLDMIRWNGDLSKYASAIGGLIRMDVN